MKIGVIGGGQLGRMMALAGTPLGMSFAFLDPAPDACAQALGEHIRADYGDQDHLRQLADEVETGHIGIIKANTLHIVGNGSAKLAPGSHQIVLRKAFVLLNLYLSCLILISGFGCCSGLSLRFRNRNTCRTGT